MADARKMIHVKFFKGLKKTKQGKCFTNNLREKISQKLVRLITNRADDGFILEIEMDLKPTHILGNSIFHLKTERKSLTVYLYYN